MRKRHFLIGGVTIFVISRLFVSGETPVVATPTRTEIIETTNTSSPPTKLTTTADFPSAEPPKRSDHAALASLPRETQKPVLPSLAEPQDLPIRFVEGSGVALREAPSPQGKILDRYDKGRRVSLIESGDGWSRVRDELTQKVGWMATRFLTNAVKRTEEPRKENGSPQKLPQPKIPVVPDTAIIQRIIAYSIGNYSGSCACPYSTDRRGRRCGSRSAHSKPGGAAPVCYPQDVTAAMIEAFRRQ